MFQRCLTLSAILVTGCCAQTTLFLENFAGSGSTFLHGTAPAVRPGSETWTNSTGATAWRADGSITGTGSSNAFLPFQPSTGQVYTLSMDANPLGATSNWFALGFADNASVNDGFQSASNPAAWMLLRGQRGSGAVQTFLGPNTIGSNNHSAGEGIVNLKVVLNTTAAQWTAQWFIDGSSVRSQSFATNPTIDFIGFGTLGSLSGTVDNFTLTTSAVPEPATYAFVVAAAAFGVGLRRRKTARAG